MPRSLLSTLSSHTRLQHFFHRAFFPYFLHDYRVQLFNLRLQESRTPREKRCCRFYRLFNKVSSPCKRAEKGCGVRTPSPIILGMSAQSSMPFARGTLKQTAPPPLIGETVCTLKFGRGGFHSMPDNRTYQRRPRHAGYVLMFQGHTMMKSWGSTTPFPHYQDPLLPAHVPTR